MRRSYPFHVLATLLFALFVLLGGGLVGTFVYFKHRELLLPTLQILSLALVPSLPLVWWIARRTTVSLRRLADTAAAIKAFRFPAATPGSHVGEIDALAATMQQMSATIRRFLDIAAHLSAAQHYDRLLDEIVAEAIAEAQAGAGAVYLFGDDRQLQPMAWRRVAGKPPLPPAAVDPARAEVFGNALERPGPSQFVLPPAHTVAGLAWVSGWFPGQYVQVLMVPLRNHTGNRLGLLLLARGAEAGSYAPALVSFIDALSGTMAVTIEKQGLLDSRQALLDGLIRMIAGAIDARSPYTSGHCRRVPELVALLAEAAAKHPASPYRDAPLDKSAREALHLAAWLHDCGKLFVPDYITDKAVKLETVHNRIHEIRTRFEVLKRDAEIACWRGVAAGGDAAALHRELEAAWQALDADYAFVAACNLGERPLSAADVERLVRIGARTWQRTLDDRIGIAEPERQRKAAVPPRALPALEHLLADRLEHLIDSAPQWDRAGRHRMPPPRHRLNCGELYCLSVPSGTLTPEERYLINAHILGTIAMLSALPFPPELASVPEVAGSHHEHLDGSGYPAGKRAEELPLAARIIAIADVFEALTARDRPYRPGKTEAEALALMADMARAGHLDPALFELFVQADIPARYAAAQATTGATAEAPAT
jgi:HD-GYP domain-containing protein (c-di-GMP phosphodiesterase class II)